MPPFRHRQADENFYRPVSPDFDLVRAEQKRPVSAKAPQHRVIVIAEDLRLKPLRHLKAVVIGETGDRKRILHRRPSPASAALDTLEAEVSTDHHQPSPRLRPISKSA